MWADVAGVGPMSAAFFAPTPSRGGAGPRGEEGLLLQEAERIRGFVTDSQ